MTSALLIAGLMLCGCGREPASAPASGPASLPETRAESMPGGKDVDRTLRVLLLDRVQTASLVLADRFSLFDPSTRQTLRADQPAGEVAVTFAADHIDFASIGFQADCQRVDLVPAGNKPVQVKLDQDWQDFRGGIRLERRADGGAVIELVDIEDYLVGVVASELPGSFSREAFRAQAIACRTYAWYSRQTTGTRRDWDVWANEKSQVYRGLERQRLVPQAAEAVRQTRGIVCTWNSPRGDKIFCAYYSSRCGGTTTAPNSPGRDGPIPPLAGNVACVFCRRPDAYRWPVEPRLAKSLVGERLGQRYSRFASLATPAVVEAVQVTPDGRVQRIAVVDEDEQRQEIDGESFRLTVDPTGRLIQSTCFRILDEGDEIVLTDGRGMGHGMGMCQYGANAMAEAGLDAPAILQHYFPGSKLSRAY